MALKMRVPNIGALALVAGYVMGEAADLDYKGLGNYLNHTATCKSAVADGDSSGDCTGLSMVLEL